MIRLLLILVLTVTSAHAKSTNNEIYRTAQEFICDNLRWRGLSNGYVKEMVYKYRIIQGGKEVTLGFDRDIYDLSNERGISYMKMAPTYDGHWSVFSSSFLTKINDGPYAKTVYAQFVGKPRGSFRVSRHACAGYLMEKSPLKNKIQIAAIIAVNNFMKIGSDITNISEEKVCSFNESDNHMRMVVKRGTKTKVYVAAIRLDIEYFSDNFENTNELVVQQIYEPEASGVVARC